MQMTDSPDVKRILGVDPAESTGLALVQVPPRTSVDKPALVESVTVHPTNAAKEKRLHLLNQMVYAQLCDWTPMIIAVEAARKRPFGKSSTAATIGAGENRGAVLAAIGKYADQAKCQIVFLPAPDRHDPLRTATKGRARMSCMAWFGVERTNAMSDDEVDAACVAVAARHRGSV